MKKNVFLFSLLCLLVAVSGCVKNTATLDQATMDPDQKAIARLLDARAHAASDGDAAALAALYGPAGPMAQVPEKPRKERVVSVRAITVLLDQGVAEYAERWTRGMDSQRVGMIAFVGKYDGEWKLHDILPTNEVIDSLQ